MLPVRFNFIKNVWAMSYSVRHNIVDCLIDHLEIYLLEEKDAFRSLRILLDTLHTQNSKI